jgi:hypothetical protein
MVTSPRTTGYMRPSHAPEPVPPRAHPAPSAIRVRPPSIPSFQEPLEKFPVPLLPPTVKPTNSFSSLSFLRLASPPPCLTSSVTFPCRFQLHSSIGAPPPHHYHHRQVCFYRRPDPVSPAPPSAGKRSCRAAPILPVLPAQPLAPGSSRPAGPLPQSDELLELGLCHGRNLVQALGQAKLRARNRPTGSMGILFPFNSHFPLNPRMN